MFCKALAPIIGVHGVKALGGTQFNDILDDYLSLVSNKFLMLVLRNMKLVDGFNQLFICKCNDYESMNVERHLPLVNNLFNKINIGISFILIENNDILINVNSALLLEFVNSLEG